MDETIFIAALLDSRDVYAALKGRILLSDFSEFGRQIVKSAVRFYKDDENADAVDRNILAASLRQVFPNSKQSDALVDYLDDVPRSKSTANAANLYLQIRKRKHGLDIADLILKGADSAKVDEAIAKYQSLDKDTSTAVQIKERLTYEDLYGEGNNQEKLRVYPKRLNTVLRGGVRRGNNILVFGRPDAGKTLVTVNLAAGMAHAGLKVLYIANEESPAEIQRRFLSRLGRVSLHALNQEDVKKEGAAWKLAEGRAMERGYKNVIVTNEYRQTRDLEALVERVRPDVLVLDQIRHVNEQLDLLQRQETVTRWLRDTAQSHNLIGIGTAQAGNSAEGQSIVRLTDLDFSNTGVQGACDLMIGLAVTDEMRNTNKRVVCVCRNKISGVEATFPIWIDPLHTKVKGRP